MDSKKHILIVEDDNDIRDLVLLAGKKRGYNVEVSRNGEEAKELIKQGKKPNIIILDINMPKMDGFQFCRWIRDDYPLVPVIFLSARNEEYDKLIALEIGGDDYLTKPFSIKELFARVSVSLRRVDLYKSNFSANELVKVNDVEIDKESWSCFYLGAEVILTISEFRILLKLADNPGVVFNRDRLIRAAFPEDIYNSGRSIDIHISRIRKKFQRIDSSFNSIETVFQVGYKWRG